MVIGLWEELYGGGEGPRAAGRDKGRWGGL